MYDRMWSRLSGHGPTDARSTPSPPPAETTKNVSGCCPVPLEVCVVITTPTPLAPPTPHPNLQLSPLSARFLAWKVGENCGSHSGFV